MALPNVATTGLPPAVAIVRGSRMLSSITICTFRSALPVAVAFFQSCFQQVLRLDRPVFGSLRWAPFFLALLFPFYMFGSYYVFGISLVGSTSGGSAVPVCPARLSDVSLASAMTRATLYALGTGKQGCFYNYPS